MSSQVFKEGDIIFYYDTDYNAFAFGECIEVIYGFYELRGYVLSSLHIHDIATDKQHCYVPSSRAYQSLDAVQKAMMMKLLSGEQIND